MYKKYFTEYYVSDEEQKEKIYQTLESLNIFSPEEFPPEIVKSSNPQQSAEAVLQNLINFNPSLKNLSQDFDVLTISESLRVTSIYIDGLLHLKRLEYLLLKLIHMIFSTQLLGIKLLIATEITEKKLNQSMQYNTELLISDLFNPMNNAHGRNRFSAVTLAEEIVENTANNEIVGDLFVNLVNAFEAAIEDYIKQGLPNIVHEMFNRIFFEAIITHANFIDNSLNLDNPLTSEDKKEWVNMLLSIARKSTNFRLDRTHGGQRERKGFSWTDKRKIEFYEMVESIPKIDRKKNGKLETIHLWEHIYELFNTRGYGQKSC